MFHRLRTALARLFRRPDGYDLQIAYLTAHPEEIEGQWVRGLGLFAYASKGRPFSYDVVYDMWEGCLTMIRADANRGVVGRPDLTAAIRADKRLPKTVDDVTPRDLPAFAYWQRRLDKELDREPFEFEQYDSGR